MNQQQFETSLLSRIDNLNKLLVPYGRVLLPLWMSNKYMEFAERLANGLGTAPTDQQRADILKTIDTFIARDAFDPIIRAFQCHRATEIPGIQDYSDHLERATVNYYRRDYLSALKVMVPLIEGIILRLMQAPLTQHVTNSQLINFLSNMQPNPANDPAYALDARLPGRFAAFRDLLCDFLNGRFYEKVANAHSQGQFDFSMLNRHFILHQLHNTPFDSLHDCQTMFQLFDLLLETISCQTGRSSSYCLVPEDSAIRSRESYYWSVILNDYFHADNAAEIVDILALHPGYHHPAEDTNWLALNGDPMEDKEVMMLSLGMKKVPQRTIANLVMNLPRAEARKQEKFKNAIELRLFVESAIRDEVAKKAYELWLRRGRTHGHDLKDWFDAEKDVRRKYPN